MRVPGGTAGCIVASRLADADPQLSILLIEGGLNNFNLPQVVRPALYRANFAPGSKTSVFHWGREEEQLAGRKMVVATGDVLGGGSSVNGLIYARPQQGDFDSWDAKGWSHKELLPFLKKVRKKKNEST